MTSYVRQGEHVLTISAPTNHIMYYQFTASGSVRKFGRDPYGTVPAATVTVDGEDDLKGCLVHGATNGGADVYAVSGELTYANLSGPGALDGTGQVYFDGLDITTSFERGTPPSSDTDTECVQSTTTEETTSTVEKSTVVCDARRANSQVEITIQVTDTVSYHGQSLEGVMFILNPGQTASVPFTGDLLCFNVLGGDCTVTMDIRN